jgi:DNA-binding CsgD family transcriptional regulator
MDADDRCPILPAVSHGDAEASGPSPGDALAALIDALDQPAAIVDALGRRIAANRAAAAAIGPRGVVDLVCDRLLPVGELDRRRWLSMLLAARDTGRARGVFGCSARRVEVCAVAIGSHRIVLLLGPALDPRQAPHRAVARAALENGLSDSETDVLARLVDGCSVPAIARARGTRVTTVRAQVRALLHKTGTHGIRALVIATLSPCDGPESGFGVGGASHRITSAAAARGGDR